MLKLHIKFAAVPTQAVASILPIKFGKIGSVTFTHDDVSPGAEVIYDYLRSKSFTDGCGNSIPFTQEIACINYLNGMITSERARQRANEGDDFVNHGYTHGGFPAGTADPIEDVTLETEALINGFNFRPGYTAVPENFNGFANAAFLDGQKGVTSTGDSTFDQFQSDRVYMTFPPVTNPWTFLAIVRDFNDEWNNPSAVNFCKTLVDDVISGARNYASVGTHSTFETQDKLDGIHAFLDYIQTAAQDRILVTPMRDILDYRETIVQPTTQVLAGDTLTFSLDDFGFSPVNRYKDISIHIESDQDIQSVTVEGFQSASFNPTTGLVNGFLRRDTWVPITPPEEETFTMNLGKIVLETPEQPTNFYQPTSLEAELFNSLVMGGYGRKYNASTITQIGESQGIILDLIGNRNIPYVGIAAPAVAGVPPIFAIPFGLKFENNPDSHYESASYTGIQPPFEMHHVIARLPGQNYEGFFPGGNNRGYIGDADGIYRIINSGESDISGVEAPFYTVTYLRLRVNTNASAELWENGISKGLYAFKNDDRAAALAGNFIKNLNGIGVNTNVADYLHAQSGVVPRALSDTEALNLYNSTNTKFTAEGYAFGTFVAPLRFSNILWNVVGSNLVPAYTTVNETGKTLADPSTWLWDWRLKTNQSNFATQVQLGTSMTLPNNSYPANNGSTVTGASVKYRFLAKYTDGSYDKLWTSSVFTDIPPGTGHN